VGPMTPKKVGDPRLRLVRPRPMPRWGAGRFRRLPAGSNRPGRRLERLAGLLAVILLFGGAAFLAARLEPLPPRFSGIAYAADGDSLRVGGDRIRLIGIDAPEREQICWQADGTEWACGRAAHDRLRDLLAAGPADCQPEGGDKYGRTLASCEVADVDLGAALVSEGLAIAYGDYEREENSARRARLGIWQGRFVDPRRWREEGPVEAPQPGFFEMLWNWFRELTGATTLR
jgi:endonuclease YncB( thermonuclease family)